MNLESFRNSRRRSANLAADMPYLAAPDAPGWIFAGDLFIEDDGATACLTVGADSWAMPSHLLGDLEAVLYQWALGEGYWEDTEEEQRAGTEAAAAIAEWSRANSMGQDFALAMIRNASRANAGVCHLQDVADIWAFLEDCPEDAAEDAYAIARAELLLAPSRLYA